MEIEMQVSEKPTTKTFPDLTGQTFARLTVISYWGRKSTLHFWNVRCECGTVKEVSGWRMVNGITKSCGCIRASQPNRVTHGNYASPEYKTYCSAKTRCNNPKQIGYKYYGGRGIEFRFTSFEEFLNDVGRKPTPKHTIDRIDNNGHYEVGNVRWATAKEQRQNQRIKVTVKKPKTVKWYASNAICGLKRQRKFIAEGKCRTCGEPATMIVQTTRTFRSLFCAIHLEKIRQRERAKRAAKSVATD